MGTEVAKTDQSWRTQIAAMEPQFERALPAHVPVERFVRATETAVMRDPELTRCDRKSLFQAVMQSAECGLMPNGRDAALVRFKSQVQFIPMVGGLLRLMRNTGEVRELVAEVICENDEFFYRMGDDPKLDHTPAFGERGEVIGAYAVLKTKDGGVYREVMGRSEIDKIRAVSRAGAKGPWGDWYAEMAKKTVLRRLAKRCPLSTDYLDRVIDRDNETYDLSAITQPPTGVEQIRQKLIEANDLGAGDAEDFDSEQEFEQALDDAAETGGTPTDDDVKAALETFKQRAAKAETFDELDGAYSVYKAAIEGGNQTLIGDQAKSAEAAHGAARVRIKRETKEKAA